MSSETPLVSVVLPVFNGAAFVTEAVRSIQRQDLTDWELVLVDDGSADGSLGLCQSLASKDSRLRVLRNEANQGLAKTMNRLISLARGRYIAVQEQDDLSECWRLALEVEILGSHPDVGLVSGVAAWIDDEGKVFNHFPGLLKRGEQYPQTRIDMVKLLFTEQCKIANAACMFRRTLAGEIPGPFDEKARMSIDWQFFLHVAHRHLIYGIPRELVRMRRGLNHQSLSRKKQLQFREARRCIRKIYIEYRERGDSPINTRLYRQAMATQLVLEARTWGGFKSCALLALAFLHSPFHAGARQSFLEFCQRARHRMIVRQQRISSA